MVSTFETPIVQFACPVTAGPCQQHQQSWISDILVKRLAAGRNGGNDVLRELRRRQRRE
jgi:hypothetical protein